MPLSRVALLLALVLTASNVVSAQETQPVTGDTLTYSFELSEGSHLLALPVVPESQDVEDVIAPLLPDLLLVQDDAGRYFVPDQDINDLDEWSWYKAYRVHLEAPALFSVHGATIRSGESSLMVEEGKGNWIPYLSQSAVSVEEGLGSLESVLVRVEDEAGQYFAPGDAESTLDSLRTGRGYVVWVSESATLTYPGEPSSEEPDTQPPTAPAGLEAVVTESMIALDWEDNAEDDLPTTPYEILRSTIPGTGYQHLAWQNSSSHTDAFELEQGITYYYVVTARDAAGNISDYSTEVSATLVPVNEAPMVVNPFADVTCEEGSPAVAQDAALVFADDSGITLYALSGSPATTTLSGETVTTSCATATTETVEVCAQDAEGLTVCDAFSVSVEATPGDGGGNGGGVFAFPASPTPTAVETAIGMRAEFSANPKPFNNNVGTAYDGATTQGERLWIGVGGTGYSYGHPITAVDPDGQGIRARLVNAQGGLSDLPPLGTAPSEAYTFCHEGTNAGATVRLPDGSTATYLHIMDDACSEDRTSFRMIESADGTVTREAITYDGASWSKGAKHHALASSDGGLVVMHDHGAYPDLMVDGDGDGDFHALSTDYNGQSHSVFRLGAVADTIWYVSTESPILSKIVRSGPDAASITRVVHKVDDFWGAEFDVQNGFGATVRYVGPAANQPGFVLYSAGSSRLDYHNGVSGSVIPVDEVSAYVYQNVGGVTYRVRYPDLQIERLDALTPVGNPATSMTPTWTQVADLERPAGWPALPTDHIEITENGSVWVLTRRNATFPANGATRHDIAAVYYRSAGLLP